MSWPLLLDLGHRAKQLCYGVIALVSALVLASHSWIMGSVYLCTSGFLLVSERIPLSERQRYTLLYLSTLLIVCSDIALRGQYHSWSIVVAGTILNYDVLGPQWGKRLAYFTAGALGILPLLRHSAPDVTLIWLGSIGLLIFLAQQLVARKENWKRSLNDLNCKDASTQLFNVSELQSQMARSISLADRHQLESCLVSLRVNRYDDVYQQHGMLQAESLMQEVSQVVASRVRRTDLLFRSNHETLCILAMPCLEEQASKLRQDIETSCAQYAFALGDLGPLKSAVTCASDYSDPEKWMTAAEQSFA